MPTQISEVVQHLCRAVLRHDEAGLTDGQLLGRFIEQRDEAAVAALVRRHGPMVWGVCRRILRTHHDAEDAFQATFLVLVRKAGSVREREMVGNWLYGVAHQTALKARATATKQLARERQVVDMPESAVTEKDLSSDLHAVLDQELSRLPDKYRVGIVLCDLEGKTRKEAARQLGLPEGTLAGRLTRGRAMLAKRLARSGLAVSGGTLATVFAQQAASGAVPTLVMTSTIEAVTLVASGNAAVGVISAKVATLTEGVLKAMLISKLKMVVAVVLVLGFIVSGATVLSCRTSAAQGDRPPIAEEQVKTPQKQEPEREKEAFTAWGKEVGGVQAGLGFLPGQKRVYHHGETVKLVVRVRNVGKKAVKFEYLKECFFVNPPTVMDGVGKLVPQPRASGAGPAPVPTEVSLPPGKEIMLAELRFELLSPANVSDTSTLPLYGAGKISVQYERVLDDFGGIIIKLHPTLRRLATGKLELEVRDTEKLPEKKKKEAFTAWGKEIGGLQAGLGYRPGEKRAYRQGETVRVVARVRNVGKEAVDFKYIREFFVENPPKIMDANGKMVQLPNYRTRDKALHTPRTINVAPGKEVELYEWTFDLQANGENSSRSFIHGTGKFSLQCERIVGPTWLNPDHPNPTLSKLATGKLELEIKSDPPPADKKKPKQKQEEGFTAWGKEVGGLQAGVTLRPGERRAYKLGEVITLVVRVRNVGKKAVKFEYVRQFLDENLPTVTNADGKPVEQRRLSMLGFHVPMEVTLEPGKEIELESRLPLRYELRPATDDGAKPTTKERTLFVGTGKVSIQYDHVLGSSSSGTITLDSTLSKFGTGKLELEITSDPPAPPEKKGPQKQEKEEQTAKKFWAGMSVNQPLFRAGQNTNLLQFNFALVNESDKVIDPKIPGYPRLIVNGKELDLSSIPGVGPRDERFKALPPGDNLQFGRGAGQFFEKPGVYRVYWQGEEFRSNEVVFRVMK